jgi:hypothetical protein
LSSYAGAGQSSHSNQRWQMDQVNMKNREQSKRLSLIEKPKQFDASKDTFSMWFAQFYRKILYYELTDQEANLVFIDRIKDAGLQALVCNMLDSNPGIKLEQLASKLNLLLGGLSTSDYSMLVRQLSRATNESISSFAIRVTSCTISSIPPEEQDVQLQLKSFHLQMLSSFLNGMHNKTLHREVLKSSAQTIDQALLVINQVVASEKSILLDHDLGPSRDKEKTLASEVQLSNPKKSRFLTVNNVIDEDNESRARTQDENEDELDENANDE